MGQKKETFPCPIYMLSGIALGAVRSPTFPALQHDLSSLATLEAEACDAGEGKLGPHMRRFELKPLPPEVLERIRKLSAEREMEK
jgi:hypothetical protein